MSSAGCNIAVEDRFGPAVASSCLGGFDFTLLFEESILTILPLALAVLIAAIRLCTLRGAQAKIKHSYHEPCKLLAYLSYMALQIVLLALWAKKDRAKTRTTLATISMSLAAFVPFTWLSYWENRRSLRPSTHLTVYLGLSLLLDLARVRTLFYINNVGHTIASVFLASYLVKTVLLGLELLEKRHLIMDGWKEEDGPENTASAYRRALFLWLNGLFIKGYRTLLSVETLPKIDSEILSASDPTALEAEWARANSSSKYALLWIFATHYKWTVLAAVLPRLAYTGFTFAQPFLIHRVLSFTSSAAPRSANVAYGLIGAYAIVYIGSALSLTLYEHKVYRTLTKFRGSLIALVYGKTLRLSSSSSSWNAEAITLMSADIDRLGICAQDVHEIYAGTIEVGLCLWLLYVYLGVAAAAAAGFSALCLALSVPVATAAGKAQVPWLDAIETRLTETAHTLVNFKLIRMMGLTEGVSSVLRALRMSEIAAARRYRILNVCLSVLYYLSYAFSPVWGFGVYILLARGQSSGTLLQSTAFAAQAIFTLLNKPTVKVIDAIEHLQVVIECFGRMQEYLTREEQDAYRTLASAEEQQLKEDRGDDDTSSEKATHLKQSVQSGPRDIPFNAAAVMCHVSLRYSPEQKPVLQDLNLRIPNAHTTVVLGPVGSGKTTLLRLLLGATPKPEKSTKKDASYYYETNFTEAAYCPQQPWMSKATIRENIVGMSLWDESWYKQVLQACDLLTDINDLPNGEQTQIGVRGSSLSGGQRLRVSLARALYSRRSVVILDDVLTGLDPLTEQNVSAAVFGPSGLVKRYQPTVIMASSSTKHIGFADHVIVLEKDGKVAQAGPADEYHLTSLSSTADFDGGKKQYSAPTMPKQETVPELTLSEMGIPEEEQDAAAMGSRQKGDYHAYLYYSQVAGWKNISIWLFFSCVFMFGLNFPTVWLQWWADSNAHDPNNRVGYWLGVYAGLAFLALVTNVIADGWVQLVVVPKTSAGFHELLLKATTRARTVFFTSTHGGAILNRFSQDLELIDSELPGAIDKTLFSALQTIFTTALVFAGSGYLSCALPACVLIIYGIQHFYLRTSRQLRHVDIEAKEPLFSHFLDTVSSVDSIRAYGWEIEYKRKNRDALNASQPPYYLMWTIQRWLTLVLNLFVAALAILLVALATNIENGSTAFLGTALSNIVNFGTTLQLLVADWTQLETAICAISRVKTFVKGTEPEEEDEIHLQKLALPPKWPAKGEVVFEGVQASYASHPNRPVLQDINLTIRPGERVAVCGRTGSGKSTLMSTLLRMVDLDSGKILIDGIDIATMSRETVRRCLTAMPQETFFITGTIRQNLDPLRRLSCSDDQLLLQILEDLGLKEAVSEAGGLDAELNADDVLSSGQQQLFCLARAIVRGGQILLLDEATSSVDQATSELMQLALRKTAGGEKKTVIAIAHHLETILDFDRVIVLNKGRILESGNPRELLKTAGSVFKSLSDGMMSGSDGSTEEEKCDPSSRSASIHRDA
ncbi:hypothetical protein ED733_001354 [Metarhizium rileyi]|uniref:ABC transporter n=1 Tax=Metarhizium rileyi (strain RCEF 4871) TaxID=1649241 RepID=A0A5C6G021_METRR|nr:hypothetical protein ED733_001354 [Metarhizium rileyi]